MSERQRTKSRREGGEPHRLPRNLSGESGYFPDKLFKMNKLSVERAVFPDKSEFPAPGPTPAALFSRQLLLRRRLLAACGRPDIISGQECLNLSFIHAADITLHDKGRINTAAVVIQDPAILCKPVDSSHFRIETERSVRIVLEIIIIELQNFLRWRSQISHHPVSRTIVNNFNLHIDESPVLRSQGNSQCQEGQCQ